MIQMIMAAMQNDTGIIPIAKTWILGIISLWIGMTDVDIFFKVLVAVSVIIYTTLKSISVHEDNLEKRNKRKNGKHHDN